MNNSTTATSNDVKDIKTDRMKKCIYVRANFVGDKPNGVGVLFYIYKVQTHFYLNRFIISELY